MRIMTRSSPTRRRRSSQKAAPGWTPQSGQGLNRRRQTKRLRRQGFGNWKRPAGERGLDFAKENEKYLAKREKQKNSPLGKLLGL